MRIKQKMRPSLKLEALPIKDQPDIKYKVILNLNPETKVATAFFGNDSAVGTFSYDPKKVGILDIVFNGLTGPGSSGGWNNESLKIIMSDAQYTTLQKIHSVVVVFRSQRFFNAPIAAILSRLEKEIKP